MSLCLELFSFTVLLFIFPLLVLYSYLIYLIYLPFICQRPIYYGLYINMNYRFTPPFHTFQARELKIIFPRRHETVSVCQFAYFRIYLRGFYPKIQPTKQFSNYDSDISIEQIRSTYQKFLKSTLLVPTGPVALVIYDQLDVHDSWTMT